MTDPLATMTLADRERELLELLDLVERWATFALVRRRDSGDEELWTLRDGALWSEVAARISTERRAGFAAGHARTEARLWNELLAAAQCLDSVLSAARGRARRDLAAACRRYRRASTPPRETVPAALRRDVLAAWDAGGRRCGICGEEMAPDDALALDHIVPVSCGGATTAANLRVVHACCNEQRGAWLWEGAAPLDRVALGFERPHPSPCATLSCRLCGAPALGYVDVEGLPTLRLCPEHQGWSHVRALLAGYGVPEAVLARVRYDGGGAEAEGG